MLGIWWFCWCWLSLYKATRLQNLAFCNGSPKCLGVSIHFWIHQILFTEKSVPHSKFEVQITYYTHTSLDKTINPKFLSKSWRSYQKSKRIKIEKLNLPKTDPNDAVSTDLTCWEVQDIGLLVILYIGSLVMILVFSNLNSLNWKNYISN